jgi:hypothetical protein
MTPPAYSAGLLSRGSSTTPSAASFRSMAGNSSEPGGASRRAV